MHVFEGHAKWSRTQLMNEIARGGLGAVSGDSGGSNVEVGGDGVGVLGRAAGVGATGVRLPDVRSD